MTFFCPKDDLTWVRTGGWTSTFSYFKIRNLFQKNILNIILIEKKNTLRQNGENMKSKAGRKLILGQFYLSKPAHWYVLIKLCLMIFLSADWKYIVTLSLPLKSSLNNNGKYVGGSQHCSKVDMITMREWQYLPIHPTQN